MICEHTGTTGSRICKKRGGFERLVSTITLPNWQVLIPSRRSIYSVRRPLAFIRCLLSENFPECPGSAPFLGISHQHATTITEQLPHTQRPCLKETIGSYLSRPLDADVRSNHECQYQSDPGCGSWSSMGDRFRHTRADLVHRVEPSQQPLTAEQQTISHLHDTIWPAPQGDSCADDDFGAEEDEGDSSDLL
jgi:hypothetical protein